MADLNNNGIDDEDEILVNAQTNFENSTNGEQTPNGSERESESHAEPASVESTPAEESSEASVSNQDTTQETQNAQVAPVENYDIPAYTPSSASVDTTTMVEANNAFLYNRNPFPVTIDLTNGEQMVLSPNQKSEAINGALLGTIPVGIIRGSL